MFPSLDTLPGEGETKTAHAATAKPDSGVLSLSYLLSPDTKADLHIKGPVGPDELEMLRDQLELTIRALSKRKQEEVTQAVSGG